MINLTTERSPLANKILELAINRNPKSVLTTQSNDKLEVATKSPEEFVKEISETRDNINMMSEILKENLDSKAASTKLSSEDIERTKQMLQKDIAQYNQDVKLLSLLVGKPLSSQDINKLATTNLGKITFQPNRPISSTLKASPVTKLPAFSQLPTTTSNIPAFKPLNDNESNFLKALEGIKSTTTTTTTTEKTTTSRKPINLQPKSQEALIAAYLKQQGIGPNSQIPIDVCSRKKIYRFHNPIDISYPFTF